MVRGRDLAQRIVRGVAAALGAAIALSLPSMASGEDSAHIYGIHSWANGAGGLRNGRGAWTVEVVNTDEWPYDPTPAQIESMAAEGFTLIIRINKFFGQTVPESSAEFDAFAAACAQKVEEYGAHCTRWIIGNEMNADFEGAISVGTYVRVYTRCRTAIHEVQPEAEVLVGAVAPWNSTTSGIGPYPSNQRWLDYMYQLVHDLGADADGYAIHAYGGRGGDADPRDDNGWGFGVFRDWMEIIDSEPSARNQPVYLTEMNHAADGQGSTPGFPLYDYPPGYIQRLYEAIDDWNAAERHDILCAAWFSYANPGFPGYNISTTPQMADDFSATTRDTDYRYDHAWLPAGHWSLR